MLDLKTRHRMLRDAQAKADKLFLEIEARNIIRPNVTERDVNEAIYNLAFEMFRIKKYWHKRIVRAGKNTLLPYRENPPELELRDDDIVFLDLGPIFENWEADFGRTFVIGNDPLKQKLRDDVGVAWNEGKQFFQEAPEITGSELFMHMCQLATRFGWTYGGPHAGHLIGEFPHEKIQGEEVQNYIHPDNHRRMRDVDHKGQVRDWILEVHFVDSAQEIGGFFEQLLTVECPEPAS